MAKILNMSQTGYSKYETGENDIPADLRFNFLNPILAKNIDFPSEI